MRAALVAVIGAEGIGKTRLAAELAGGGPGRDGGDVRYLAGRGPPAAVLAALGSSAMRRARRSSSSTTPTERREIAALAGLAQALAGVPVLVLVCGRDAEALAGVGAPTMRSCSGRWTPRRCARSPGAGRSGRVVLDDRRRRAGSRACARWPAGATRGGAPGRGGGGADRRRSRRAALDGGRAGGRRARAAGGRRRTPGGGADDGPVRCPFKGLASFDVADAPYFFGRERLVAELVARLVGARCSGSWVRREAASPRSCAPGCCPRWAAACCPAAGLGAGRDPARASIRCASSRTPRRGSTAAAASVLAVDQFEETFTACRDEAERARSSPSSSAARSPRPDRRARDPGRLLRALRRLPGALGLLAAHHVLVGAMRRDELRRAVERPALRVGLRVEPELTDALVADVEHEPGALPMLSTALLELWQRRDGRSAAPGRLRGHGRRARRGGAARRGRLRAGSIPTQQAVARSVLLRLAAEGAGGAVERRRVPLAELATTMTRARRRGAHRPAPAHGQRRARSSSRTRRCCASGRGCAAGSRRTPRAAACTATSPTPRASGTSAGATPAICTAARAWPPRWSGAPATSPTSTTPSAPTWTPAARRAERAHAAPDPPAARRRLAVARARRRSPGISTVLAVRGIQRARSERRAAASRNLATRAAGAPRRRRRARRAARPRGLPPRADRRSAQRRALGPAGPGRRPQARAAARTRLGLHSVAISPDGRRSPAPPTTGRSRCGTAPPAAASARRSRGTPERQRRRVQPRRAAAGAAAADDATVRLWDVAARRPLGRLLAQRPRP